MIVRPTPQGALHVTQADHARFAAELLRLFRLPELVAHPRRDLLLRAVAEHDNGWWEADSAPRLAASGDCALDFRALPAGPRQEIWRRGVERFASETPYLAALLATHILRLSGSLQADPAWQEFRTAIRVRCEELLAAAGAISADLADDDGWLGLADALSLAVCAGDAGLLDRPGWRLELREPAGDGEGLSLVAGLQPFPFAGSTVFEFSGRRLSAVGFPTAAALGVALATAPWERLRIRFTPL